MNDLNMTITPAADKFVRRMLRFDGGPMSGLRLSVAPGGSSGLSSQFAVADELKAGETVFEVNGLRFFLLAESRMLLRGVTMDFQETATTAGFKFYDPSKLSTCGTHNHDTPSSPEHVHEH
jgi:iron-sulfur cluster assembly accessory protein